MITFYSSPVWAKCVLMGKYVFQIFLWSGRAGGRVEREVWASLVKSATDGWMDPVFFETSTRS